MPASELLSLMNLGPATVRWLNEIGIYTRDELEAVGAVAAYRVLKHQRPDVSLNALYALHGALVNERWDRLSPDVKADLRSEAEGPLEVRVTKTGEDL